MQNFSEIFKVFHSQPCQSSLSIAIFLCQFGFSLPPWCFSFGGDFAWSSSRRSFCKYIITATEYRQLSKYSWKMERLAYSFRGLGLIIRRGFTCGIGLLLARLSSLRGFLFGLSGFPPSTKTNTLIYNVDKERQCMKCHTKIQLIYSIIYLALIRDNSLLKISYLSKEFNHIGVTELFCNQPQNL